MIYSIFSNQMSEIPLIGIYSHIERATVVAHFSEWIQQNLKTEGNVMTAKVNDLISLTEKDTEL